MRAELDLVRRMRHGDQRAFDEFFDRFAPRLTGFAARRSSLDDAALEDAVQVVLIKAVRNLASFRGEASLFSWLCQICRNHLADLARKGRRAPCLQSLDDCVVDGQVPGGLIEFRDPLDACTGISQRDAVRRVINGLSPADARIIELRFADEMTVPEIAKELKISVRAAESRLSRARNAFQATWMTAAH